MHSTQLNHKLDDLLHEGLDTYRTLGELCSLLKHEVDHYDWVGFYFVDAEGNNLLLGPYSGAPTNHTTIPVGRGICGQAAEREETIIVQDVSRETNYLSCSLHVKSEIVVPVFYQGSVIGQIDIDSHQHSPFTQDDRIWLERLCARIAPIADTTRRQQFTETENDTETA